MVLAKTDYDAAYFGKAGDLKRESGYTDYAQERRYNIIRRIEDAQGNLVFQGTGNWFKDRLQWLIQKTEALANKKILELGCAFGYMVEDAVALGLDWTGLDIAPVAVANASPSIAGRVLNADALAYLQTQSVNAYDFIVSFRFIECIDDSEMPALVTAMNRIGRKQIHVIDEVVNPLYYTSRTLEQWRDAFAWRKGTILIANETLWSASPKIVVV